MAQNLMLHSWPRAILHIDADAFFASCEQSMNPRYKGKPLITGKERGIVAALSYEAKALGITRAMTIFEAKKLCPGLIVLPSDYETYSLISKRMFAIIRRFTPLVEEYSIDEAFADITGFRRVYHSSYEEIAKKIKRTMETELGITFSVGLSLSKVLAKIGSKHKKPAGFVAIPGNEINKYLALTPLGKIWGIGPKTTAYCNAFGMNTALDFANKNEEFIRKNFAKPHREIWLELRGEYIYKINTEEKTSYASISKTKTFTPASADVSFVYSQLFKNLENACIKARRHKLVANGIVIFLKNKDFNFFGLEAKLNRASAFPSDIAPVLREIFIKIYKKGAFYRATGVVLIGIKPETNFQISLFESPLKIEKLKKIYKAMDELAERMGKHAIHLGASFLANTKHAHLYERGDIPMRKMGRAIGETKRKHLNIPIFYS